MTMDARGILPSGFLANTIMAALATVGKEVPCVCWNRLMQSAKKRIFLTAEDVAECVRWAVTLPPHVNIDRIDVKPIRQGAARLFVRDE